MAKHLVRIHSENPKNYTISEVDSAVQDWVNSYSEWAADNIVHEIRETGDREAGEVWLTGDFRFYTSDDKTALLDDAEASIQPYVAWYRLGYHICDHDETSRDGCTWDDEREYKPNKIPAAVPDFL